MFSLSLNVFIKILSLIITFKYRIYKSVFVNFSQVKKKKIKNPPRRRGISLSVNKAHEDHECAKHREHDARSTVERFCLRAIGKLCGKLRTDKGEEDT